eukprot:103371-Chlamydomonas_euryale.AAC.2
MSHVLDEAAGGGRDALVHALVEAARTAPPVGPVFLARGLGLCVLARGGGGGREGRGILTHVCERQSTPKIQCSVTQPGELVFPNRFGLFPTDMVRLQQIWSDPHRFGLTPTDSGAVVRRASASRASCSTSAPGRANTCEQSACWAPPAAPVGHPLQRHVQPRNSVRQPPRLPCSAAARPGGPRALDLPGCQALTPERAFQA